MASIDRGSLCRCACNNIDLVVHGPAYSGLYIDRWSFYTGGPSIQVVLLHRWSFYTGGPSIQVVLLYRWSFYTSGPFDRIHCVLIWQKLHRICTQALIAAQNKLN